VDSIIEFALKRRVLVFILMILVFAGGVVGFLRLNIEAYPDPVPPLIEVVTQSAGQSAEEIERYITIPIEIQMAGIPHVTSVRTISLFGLSDTKIQFSYDYTYEAAEQLVLNRLTQLPPLPNGAQPSISPESPIGEILRYRVIGPPGYSVMDLKTIEDWILERRFKAVPGVVDVTGFGGKTKTYDVAIDQARLIHYGLTVPQVIQALNNANVNVGGQTVDFGGQAAVVRGIGLIRSLDDIRGTMVSQNNGSPILIRDIAKVSIGFLPRLGMVGQNDDDDIVEGIVLMRRGAESKPTIQRVDALIDKINTSNILPPGVHIEKYYDRADLVNLTTHTVVENMLLGMALVFVVQWIFIGTLRSAAVVAATIPFALAFAIAILVFRGESANLLSVGAIDFGLIVDATVIMVENISRHLARAPARRFLDSGIVHRTMAGFSLRGKLAVIASSAREVSRAIFFAAAIIIAGFIPLFTLSGVEGHIFAPMAKTYAYAIIGGLVASFTLSPALSALFLPAQISQTETLLVRAMRRVYTPVIRFALANRIISLGGMLILLLLSVWCATNLGLEFLPKLEEGNFWIRADMPISISLEASNDTVNRIRRTLRSFPEVVSVVSEHGRPDDGTDTGGFYAAEFYVPLKPRTEWPDGVDKEQLAARMTRSLTDTFPGVEFNFSQHIADNVQEAASGVKGENAVKLYGNDLATLERTANQIKSVLSTVQGITDLEVYTSLGQPTVRIDVDRLKAARYGLAPGDINTTIQAAIGGQAAGNLYEDSSDRNFPIIVRLASEYRDSLDRIRLTTIGAPSPTGTGIVPIPLADVADVELVSGASLIYRDGQQRFMPIRFSVRGRDLGGAVLEARRKIAQQIRIPPGLRIEWTGEFGDLEEAISRLEVLVPVALGSIVLLLFFNFGSLVDTALVAAVMPMALVGGIFALSWTGTPFSVSAAIGFIGLFGISVMEGILVLSYYNQLLDVGIEHADAVSRAAETRLRPVMMTCFAAGAGLLPAAFATGIGSQVQKPLALVVVGGILLAPMLILVVLPVLIDVVSRHARASASVGPEAELAE
jgi:cobalt-zinc-cadmium resistance protein CzcA